MVAFSNSIDKVYDKLSNLDIDGLGDPRALQVEGWQELRAGLRGWDTLPLLAASALAVNFIVNQLQHPEVLQSTLPANVQRAEAVSNLASARLIDQNEAAKEFAAILYALSQETDHENSKDWSRWLGTKYGITGGGTGEIWTPANPPGHPDHEFQKEVIRILNDTIDQAINKFATDRTPGDTEEWAVGADAIRDKPPGMKDPRGFLNKQTLDNNQKKSTMKTFEDAYTNWVPPSVEEDNYRHERTVVKVPGPEKGEPWVHSDDDFLFFLDWLVKKGWEAQKIVDVVREPHHFTKSYGQFLDQRDREISDPLL